MMKPNTIYQDIINSKQETLEKQKDYRPLSEIKKSIKRIKICGNFKSSLMKDDDVSIISEFKPASPSRGEISKKKVYEILPLFEQGGVSAASILTEETYFKSSLDNMKIARFLTNLPLLRKDFILDEYQIYESRSVGASAVLLIADLYPDLADGIELSKYLGMDSLVECKNKYELKRALDAGAELIGINNRDLDDFSVNLNRTRSLISEVPPGVTIVSESGVRSRSDVKLMSDLGVHAVLIGSAIMEAKDIPEKIKELRYIPPKTFFNRLKLKVCGITCTENLRTCEEENIDKIGFINIKRSPRYVDLEKIAKIVSHTDKDKLVLVMENPDINEVMEAVLKTGIRTLQLHSTKYRLIKKIQIRFPEIKIICAIGICENLNTYKEREIASYAKISDGILFDYEIDGICGGTGIQIPLKIAIKAGQIARDSNKNIELFLAGGIDKAKLVAEQDALKNYYDYLDVNSKIETRPGLKNVAKLRELIKVIQ